MKNYISVLMLICFATFTNAQNDFESQWQAVSKLEKEGLTKSASDLVDTIYEKAVNSKNKQQSIKALLYKSKYLLTLEEEAQLKIVTLFKTEIDKTKDLVTKHLLENMLATMYWQYFQQNRYVFYDRTKTLEKVSDDFRTWDLETLFNEIHVYYQRSLENGLMLQQEPLDNYQSLLVEAENSKDYRPTLFDLLNHNALQFYKTDENSITQPAYKFSIDNETYISDSESFINLNLKSKDSVALQLHALKIYQNLLKFHRKDQSKAFVTTDIERLNYVSQNATFSNKEDLLLETLRGKAMALTSSPLAALYNFEIASLYQNQGNRYNSNPDEGAIDETHRWKLKEALELCNSVISKYSKSDGSKKCDILKQQILQPVLRLQAEAFTPSNATSRLLVNYKNLTILDFEIYKVTKRQLESYNKSNSASEKAKFFKKLRATETFKSELKTENDYQIHASEIVIPQLKNGIYLINAKTDSEENVFAVAHIQLTNLALVESKENEAVNYQLIDRTNGAPVVGANMSLSYTNNQNKDFSKQFTTDRFGKFKFQQDDNYYRNVEIEATFKDEIAYFGNYYISKTYREIQNKNTTYTNFLFTDRSIYRPGQTVYFKGISTQTNDNKTTVFANNQAKIRLKNVNNEMVGELVLKTNEFGSVNGEFILPNDGLTGNYTIDMFSGNYGYTSLSVEEYKRPKFKSEFQPITETFKVNDSITVYGTAMAFAGSAITNAKVVYRVKRMVNYPNWYYWRRPFFNSEPQEITFGESKTNSKGEFEITFKAIPDESVSKANLPVFKYEVSADITDLNGETRTASTIVNVGYHAMTIAIVAPELIEK
ncbi:MAG: MG2 domain-containing protein, partial [Winogradskyella sp.]|nr:MG2 domain-containing protein [Winogradskyella sp.]